MKKYVIAVCDDEEYYADELYRYIFTYANERELNIVCDIYLSGKALLDEVEKGKKYDMVFLDVEMPELDGIRTGMLLKQELGFLIICFVTSYEDYALNAFDINAEGYILKPVKYKQLKEVLDKSLILIDYHKNKEEAEKRYIEVEVGRGRETIDIKKILYLEKRRNQCVFHFRERELTCYQTLANVYKLLNQKQFLYTHQGYIVNFDHIKEVGKDCVYLGEGVEIPLSRGRAKEVRQRHHEKIFGKEENTDNR